MGQPTVYVRFPKTGLGNMLLLWANAAVFASINKMPLVTSLWWGVRWGSLLRGERNKRLYLNYFNESALAARGRCAFKSLLLKTIMNPALAKIEGEEAAGNCLYVYDKVITHERLFLELEPHRDLIVQRLYELLTREKLKELKKYPIPEIAVHIRRGDFKLTGQTTALSFFIKSIEAIRKGAGQTIPVTIFSDAAEPELAGIFNLEAVSKAPDKADILDILLMSKSRVLVLSQSSSFSYWAAFLSEALVVMKHDDWQEGLKKESKDYKEIRFNEDDETSKAYLESSTRSFLKLKDKEVIRRFNGA